MLDFLSFILFVFLFLIFPGWLFCRKLIRRSLVTTILISFMVGLFIQVVIGIILNVTFGITFVSLLLFYVVIYFSGILLNRDLKLDFYKVKTAILEDANQIVIVCIFIVITYLLWMPYFGFHAGDIGTHVFWAEEIVLTHHLPDYTLTNMFQSSSNFVFGSHFLLANYSILFGESLVDTFWYPLALFYWLILATIVSVGSLVKSKWTGIIAAALYGSSQIPASRVLLGNLPDLIGYFLVAVTILILISKFNFKTCSYLLIIIWGTALAYYAYSLITISLILSLILIMYVLVNPIEFLVNFKKIFADYFNLKSVSVLFCLGLIVFLIWFSVGYLNYSSYSALKSTNWQPLSTSAVVTNVGYVLAIPIGLAGMILLLFKNRQFSIVFIGWYLSLFLITISPLVGIGIEPIRFVWHMLEALSVPTAYLLITISTLYVSRVQLKISRHRIIINYKSKIHRKNVWRFIITIVVIVSALFPLTLSVTKNTVPPQLYLENDYLVGKWLGEHGDVSTVVTADASRDNSAPWIRAYSGLPRFVFNVPGNAKIAAPPYNLVYSNISVLYSSAFSYQAYQVVKQYNITYIVVPDYFMVEFRNSKYFSQVYNTSNVYVFETRREG